MLRFEEILIEDFGPYKGRQKIDIPDGNGITVIYGANGRGKTSLLNAFRYALFGEVKKEGQRKLPLNKISNRESVKEGKYSFKVVLNFSYEGSSFELTRQAEPRGDDAQATDAEDYKEKVILRKDGSVLGPEERKRELGRIMPEEVSRFFLFDAELLREYEELLKEGSDIGEEIKDAIEKILGVPILQNTKSDLNALIEEARGEVKREMKKHKKGEKMAAQLEDLAEQRKHHEDEIERLEKERRDLREEKKQIDRFLERYQRAKQKINEIDRLSKNISSLEDEIEEAKKDVRHEMGSVWRGMLEDEVNEALEHVENKLKKDRQYRSATKIVRIIQESIEDEECSICENSLGEDEVKRLDSKLRKVKDDVGSTLNEEEREYYTRVKSLIEDFDTSSKSVVLVSKIFEDIQSKKVDKFDKEEELKEIKRKDIEIEGKETEINEKSNRREEIIKELQSINKGLKDEKGELERKNDRMRKLEKKKVNHDDQELERAELERDEYIKLYDIFDNSVAAYRNELRKKVEADASDLFTNLSHEPGYSGLRINQNYGLSVVLEDGGEIPARSSGEGQVVALSLMGALQNNAPLQGPIIMDSSFTRLDKKHKENVINALPEMAHQIMLLVFEDELDPDVPRTQIPEYLLTEYDMVRETATHTRLEPKT